MKTQKKFDEKPLPKGWKTPPDGWVFIGMDEDLPRQDGKFMYGSRNWVGPMQYLREGTRVGPLGIAAPAHLVRHLSTQKRAARKARAKKNKPVWSHTSKSGFISMSVSDWAAKNILPEPRKPYDEKPLPAGIAPPPSWMCYLGREVKGIEAPFASLAPAQDGWVVFRTNHISGGHAGHHYAAPAELCNRLPDAPDTSAGHVKLSEPEPANPTPVEPVKGRFMVSGINLADCVHDDIDRAYVTAEDAVKSKPDSVIYIYQLRAKVTGTVNVKREVY